MIPPPDKHEDLPHKVWKHYYMMMAEMTGKLFKHDDYAIMANWMITKIHVDNRDKPSL